MNTMPYKADSEIKVKKWHHQWWWSMGGGGCSILWVVKAKFRIKWKLPPIMQFRSNSSGTIGWHHQWQGLSYHYDGSGNRSPALACPQRFKSKLHSMEALTAVHLSLSLSFPAMGRAILLDQRSNVDTKRQWWASQGSQNWSPRITEEHPGEHSILVSVTQGHATVAFLQQQASAAWRVLRSTSSYKQNPQPKPKQTNKQNKATKIQSNGINLEIPVLHSPTCEENVSTPRAWPFCFQKSAQLRSFWLSWFLCPSLSSLG